MSVELQPKEVEHEEFLGILRESRRARLSYDIESAPLPESYLRPIFKDLEIELPKHPGHFIPADVKVGNLKDPYKIEQKIAQEREKHLQAVEGYLQAVADTEKAAWQKFVDEATLSPNLSRVCAVGYSLAADEDLLVFLDISASETAMLARFWHIVNEICQARGTAVSFNGHRFDIPFLTRRSWVQGVKPMYVRTKYNKYEDWLVDLQERWVMGVYRDFISLKNLCRALGVEGKVEGMDGADFHKVLKEDPDKARQYLRADILAVDGCARKMGV